jgi:hypothetical protein
MEEPRCPFCREKHPAAAPDADDLAAEPECQHWLARFDPDNYSFETGPITDVDEYALPWLATEVAVPEDVLRQIFGADLDSVRHVYGDRFSDSGSLVDFYLTAGKPFDVQQVVISGTSSVGWSYIEYYASDANLCATALVDRLKTLRTQFEALAAAVGTTVEP